MPADDVGLEPVRSAPAGLPVADLRPPIVAESGDPFATARIIDLVARLPRNRGIPLGWLVDRLNASHLDWLFEERVVADAIVQLQANWMTDYRNTTGIVLDDASGVATLTIEDSTRVDPWIVRQAEREQARCRRILLEFSGRDRPTGEG